MNITKVQIHLNRKPAANPKAWADIIIDNEFIVRGLVIIESADAIHYVNMPNKVKKVHGSREEDTQRIDIAHPITEDCRRYIEDTVLDEYEAFLEKVQAIRDAQDKEKANKPQEDTRV